MGIKERRQREREQRRGSIVAAAKKIFLEKGIQQTTMLDIAQETELSKAALYLYFKSKEELILEMLYLSFNKIEQLMQSVSKKGKNGYERLRQAAEDFKSFFHEQPEYIYFFTLIMERYADFISREQPGSEKYVELIDRIQRQVVELLKHGIADGSIRQDLDPEKTAALFLHMAPIFMQRVSTVHKILGKNSRYKPDELIDEMFTMFFYSLR